MQAYLKLLLVVLAGSHVAWAFDARNADELDPEKWPGLCKTGTKQSPVAIATKDAVKKDLGELRFVGYDNEYAGTVTNNGYTVKVVLEDKNVRLESEYLSSRYILEQLHFHWGAEHTMDGIRHSLELHLVHYDDTYANSSVASQYKNGMAVVAVLFEVNEKAHAALVPILTVVRRISAWNGQPSATNLNEKLSPIMLLPKDRETYYTYEGSLTTPGCQEAVAWFVMNKRLPISMDQLEDFHAVRMANKNASTNYRPLQELGDRVIYRNLPGSSSAKNGSFVHVFLAVLFVFFSRLS